MYQLVAKRLSIFLIFMLTISSLSFVMMRFLSDDIDYRVAAGRFGDEATQADVDSIRKELNLDAPVIEQYADWLTKVAVLDFGKSYVSDERVVVMVWHHFEHSLILISLAVLMAIIISLPIGFYSAINRNSIVDRLGLLLSSFVASMPIFVLGIILIIIFAIGLGILPSAGFGHFQNAILPSLAIALFISAGFNRYIASLTAEYLNSSYCNFAQLKGLKTKTIVKRHALKYISIPAIAYLGGQVVTIIEGVVMIESLFTYPGIGHALTHAIFERDIPVIQGMAIAIGIFCLTINLITELLCKYLNPYSRGK